MVFASGCVKPQCAKQCVLCLSLYSTPFQTSAWEIVVSLLFLFCCVTGKLLPFFIYIHFTAYVSFSPPAIVCSCFCESPTYPPTRLCVSLFLLVADIFSFFFCLCGVWLSGLMTLQPLICLQPRWALFCTFACLGGLHLSFHALWLVCEMVKLCFLSHPSVSLGGQPRSGSGPLEPLGLYKLHLGPHLTFSSHIVVFVAYTIINTRNFPNNLPFSLPIVTSNTCGKFWRLANLPSNDATRLK